MIHQHANPVFRAILAMMAICSCSDPVLAGGGPENLILVVNADSASSKLIANHYAVGRKIPASHVVYLNGIPNAETINIDLFREKILQPLFEEIQQRRILPCIDYIVYSADFPTIIDISKDQQRFFQLMRQQGVEIPKQIFGPRASINALTFYAPLVLSNQPVYFALDGNTYFRGPASLILERPFVGPRQDEFTAATKAFERSEPTDKEFQEAIEALTKMAELNPNQVGVSYWLARFAAKAGKIRQANDWLTRAIRSGWSFRQFTLDDPAFRTIGEDPIFKGLVNRIPDLPFDHLPATGFKHNYAWGVNGLINDEPGQGNRYFLSTVLAVTRNYASNEQAALDQIKVSMQADFSHPQGTFYFANTSDVRDKTRSGQYPIALSALKRLGHKGEIIPTALPQQRDDVLGLSMGAARFNWTGSGSRIVPGAICENLTSFGGIVTHNNQTKLFEFIKFRAGGSSGTVVEPLTIPNKFPHPLIHAHYASGCSLAEAYYQAVHGPFQLLIVGDALCQPWATPPSFSVAGIEPGAKVQGKVTIEFNWDQSEIPIAGFELYLDGVPILRSPTRDRIEFDTSDLTDGYHELRFVAVANHPIQTTERVIIPFEVQNQNHQVELSARRDDFLATDTLTLTASSNFGDSIELVHHSRSVAKRIGQQVEFRVPANWLGRGPIQLRAIAIDEESQKVVSSMPISLKITGEIQKNNRKTDDVE